MIILWKKKADFENFNFYDVKKDCENLFNRLNIL